MWHLNFTNGFGGEHFALDPNNGLQTFSSPIFLSYYTQTRMSPAKKKPWLFKVCDSCFNDLIGHST